MSADLSERRGLFAACRTVILERDRFFAVISGAEESGGLTTAVMREFELTAAQADAVLNLQARHFCREHLDKLDAQIQAIDAALSR